MVLDDFLKKNNIAIYATSNADKKSFSIIRTGIPLESEDLVKQLIDNCDYDTINEYLDGAHMPRIWNQGRTKCLMTRRCDERIIALFYDSELDATEHYFLAKKLEEQILHLFK